MFAGGDYAEVGRWLHNFVTSHAKRENPRIEAILEAGDAREGQSYGIRLSLGDRQVPAAEHSPLEIAFAEVARERGSLAWCHSWAERVRSLARELGSADRGVRRSA
jgi:hypothetical protein